MKLSYFFTIQNQLQTDHWQTKSYAEHKALGNAYEALVGLFDTFMETYYGKNGIDSAATAVTAMSHSYKDGLIAQYTKTRDVLDAYLGECTGGSKDLENIRADIMGEFNHLLYRLQQK
jgi:hypothetical protein